MNYWTTKRKLRDLAWHWGDPRGWEGSRWSGMGRFPPSGKYLGSGKRDIKKCEFCDKISVLTVDLKDPREIHWLCDNHAGIFGKLIRHRKS